MKFSIAQKLMIAFLGLTLLVLVATLGLARWSFDRGFLDYVNALEQVRLQQLPDVLAREYTSSGGNWTTLTPRRFEFLQRDSRQADLFDGPPPRDPPPHLDRDGAGRPAPPRGPGPPHGGGRRGPPTAVYDVNNALIVGVDLAAAGAETVRMPIVVDGTKIGELRSSPLRQLTSSQETAFSAQQLRASWLIGAISLTLAVGFSWALARGLLAPVWRMIGDVAKLSSGDYSVRMNDKRTDELGQLMGNLDRLALTLDEARTSRRRWLADISHELRTPVTVLAGELEALQDGVRALDHNQVDSLAQEVQRLRHLIDDLYELSISDVGGLRYEFSTTELGQCLDANVDAVRSRATDQGIVLTLDSTPVTINADPNRLNQLLQNLLANSLAYTDAPGRIEICLSHTDTHAVVTIEDSPPGVSDGEYEQLFDPLFRREASRSRRSGGAGLGLAICRNIVEAHGGQISAAPSALGGLHMRIVLPIESVT